MKTIRENVFETNSSSTHSVTLCYGSGRKPSIKPYSPDGKLVINIGYDSYEDEHFYNKMGLLARYLKGLDSSDEIARVEKVVSDFSGIEISFNKEDLNKIKKFEGNNEDEILEDITDRFSWFTSSQWDSSEDKVKDFVKGMDSILATDDDILAFTCSNGFFDVDHYYDG